MRNINNWKISKVFLLTLILITNHQLLITSHAQVGVNDDNSSPAASAMLDVKSTTKGMLIPRMTTAQRDLISMPATGLMVYNTTTNSFNFYNGTAWIEITTGSDNVIADADGDTKIQVEKGVDEDSIRFDILGSERLVLKQNNSGITMLSFPNTKRNILIGQDAGLNTNLNNIPDKGQDNIFIGYQAGKTNTTGYENTFIGHQAGLSNFTGISNIFIGYKTGLSNTTGDFNTFLGDYAGNANTTAGSNTFIGNSAGSRTTTGGLNVFLGSSTGYLNTTGQQNTYIGSLAGLTNTDGERNVYLGFQAGYNATGNDKLYIENSNSNAPLIYGEFNNDLVRINGTLNINNAFSFPTTDGTTGQVLSTNGTGTLTWANATVNTDNQTIDTIQLSGDTLQLSLSNDGEVIKKIDLSSIGDIPKMSLAQRMAIASPTVGELIYDTTTKTYWYYANGQWNEIRNRLETLALDSYLCLETTGSLATGFNGLPITPTNIIVNGNEAYVEYNEFIFDIFNISNPTNPSSSSRTFYQYIFALYVSGNYAYLGGDQGFFKIVDISNPANPTTTGSLSFSGNNGHAYGYIYGITVAGNYAYAIGPDVLNVIDISNPASPTLSGTMSLSDVVEHETVLIVSGNYIYVNTKHHIKVIDISNPTNPTIVGQVGLGANSNAWSMTKSGDYLYIGTVGSKKMEIVNVSTPTNPSISSSLSFSGAIPRLVKSGNYVLAVEKFNSNPDALHLIDVRNPYSPNLIGIPFTADTIGAIAISPSGDNIYIGSNTGLNILKQCTGITTDVSSGAIVNVSSTEVDNQTLDVAQLNGDNLELSLSNDGEATKSISLSDFRQTIDVGQLNGNNLELSLSNDGQATKSIDISGIKDNLGNHTATQNIQLDSHWLSGDGGNEGLNVDNAGRVGIGRTPLNGIHNPLSVQGYYAQNTLFNSTRPGGGTYLDITNHGGGRMLLGVDGNGFTNASDTLDGVIGTWSNGDLKFFANATERMKIKKTGQVNINNTYDLPMTDGVGGQVLITDGAGTLHWGEPAHPTNIGVLGIGIQATRAVLEVNSVNGNAFMAQYTALHAGGVSGPYYNHTEQFSIYAHDAVAASEFNAFSDSRIKNIYGLSNSKKDLEQLLKIEITDYQLIDTIGQGKQMYKKVIAQQVKEVYPQAVKTNITRAIPDIYQMATVENGWIVLENDLKIGERIKIITEEDDKIYEVTEAESTRFKVGQLTTDNRQLTTVFIYGREVNDFHTVDYEAISMLNVSATQQLAKENEMIRDEINALEIQVAKINELEAIVNQIQQQLSTKIKETQIAEE